MLYGPGANPSEEDEVDVEEEAEELPQISKQRVDVGAVPEYVLLFSDICSGF